MMLFLEICFKNLVYFITKPNHRRFYLLVLWYGDVKRYTTKRIKLFGNTLTVPDCLSFIWQFKEIYVDESYAFKSTKNNPVIIDCGSNIGLSALYFHSIYPQVQLTCIEADPKIASILEQNLKANNLKAEIIAKAAWIHDEGVSFSSEGSDSGSIKENSNTTLTPSLRLKTLLNSYESIDFLKMDIEGAENLVIPDCADELRKVDKLFLEYHASFNEDQHLDKLLSILKSAGFHYYIKTENKRKSPFVNLHEHKMYDLQLNIYAYRKG